MPKKEPKDEFRCDNVKTERFFTETDETRSSWFEIICFPYTIFSKFWDCCTSTFAGTNQIFVYLMFIHYIICKMKNAVTPNPILFPYYFYMYCQVAIMGLFWVGFWMLWGNSVIMPFINNFVKAMQTIDDNASDTVESPKPKPKTKSNETRRTVSFRKYCFKKRDIYNTPLDNLSPQVARPTAIVTFILQVGVQGAQNFPAQGFQAQTDDVFKYNWSEVFCFPYVLCTRFWDCCVSICAGTNQCVVYWMMIQWLVCKITHLTTPDPIIFPYYFYVFCQVILLTSFFILVWVWFGRTLIIPYFYAFYEAFVEDITETPPKNATRLSFRKYCFRKREIFDTPTDSVVALIPNEPLIVVIMFLQVLVHKIMQ